MAKKPFDSAIIREAQEATDFMANVLEASTEYSIICVLGTLGGSPNAES